MPYWIGKACAARRRSTTNRYELEAVACGGTSPPGEQKVGGIFSDRAVLSWSKKLKTLHGKREGSSHSRFGFEFWRLISLIPYACRRETSGFLATLGARPFPLLSSRGRVAAA